MGGEYIINEGVEIMEINLNQDCTVVLAKRGVLAIEKYYERLGMEPPEKYKEGDKYTRSLWEIMKIFGEYTYMGPIPPFETTIILHERT